MLCHQFEERLRNLRAAFALGWEAVRLLNDVWQERPPYSSRYHVFRLLAHLAKYHTAEFAVHTAKWCMEGHGGLGVLEEFGVERWLREAMILAIWEGTAHRQLLDALEVMTRQQAHHGLLQHLQRAGSAPEFGELVKDRQPPEAARVRAGAHLGTARRAFRKANSRDTLARNAGASRQAAQIKMQAPALQPPASTCNRPVNERSGLQSRHAAHPSLV